LREVHRWTDGHGYYLVLAEKPAVSFPSTVAVPPGFKEEVPIEEQKAAEPASLNPFGIPSKEDWDRLWKAWDTVLGMVKKDLLHTKPINLRYVSAFLLSASSSLVDRRD
jgi:hypothetical protein